MAVRPAETARHESAGEYPRKNALLKVGNKSDRIDARKLAELLRSNLLRPVYLGAGFVFTTDQNGNLNVRIGGADIAAYPNFVTDPTKVNDGQWHHVVATIDFELQTVQIYVDGTLTSSTAMNMSANGDNGSQLQVGMNPWTAFGDYFTGEIDEVQIYSRALTDAEVKTVFGLTRVQ